MGVNFKIVYHELVVKEDISVLDATWRLKIQHAIESKLTTRPEIFGKPLRGSLKGYRKLRIGDWRVIFRIEKNVVKVFLIAHRYRVYQIIAKRI